MLVLVQRGSVVQGGRPEDIMIETMSLDAAHFRRMAAHWAERDPAVAARYQEIADGHPVQGKSKNA